MNTLIIAEIGINHDGNMHIAKHLILEAKDAGADVVKFQMYSVDALFGPEGEDPNPEIYRGVAPLEFNKEQFHELKEYCDQNEIEFMASVFDDERLGWAEEFGVKRHKIASRTSKLSPDFADRVIKTGKECIISLGFGAKPAWGCKSFSLDPNPRPENIKYLYCVSKYPTPYKDIHMPHCFRSHPIYDGFSDHTLGIGASIMAVSRKASIIEKHFTYDKAAKGFDHCCSMEPQELSDLVKIIREIEQMID